MDAYIEIYGLDSIITLRYNSLTLILRTQKNRIGYGHYVLKIPYNFFFCI